jgi:hypothetical protein
MRYHRAFRELAFPVGGDAGAIASAETLVAARFEPVLRARKGSATVDLHFRRDRAHVVIPLVILDVAMLEARERDPLVWPEFVRTIGIDDFGIALRVEAWIAKLFGARLTNTEQIKIFGDEADAAAFAAAREAGFLGAAPLEEVARRAAPFVYARREARTKEVVIAARDAALGAALLGGVARKVRIAAVDAHGMSWYAPDAGSAEPEIVIVDRHHRELVKAELERASVVIDLDASPAELYVEPAPIVPLDALFDFTGSVRRGEPAFSVAVHKKRELATPLVAESAPVGGSSGRILFGLRHGARRFGGADLDYAEWLASALRDEGFTVAVVDDPNDVAAFAPDLVHAMGLADASAAVAYLRAASARQVPFAIHPLYDAAGLEGYWGATVTPYAYRFMQDEATIAQLLQLLRERRLALNELTAATPFHPTNPTWYRDVRTAVAGADVVYVAGKCEQEALEQLGAQGEIVRLLPPIPPAGATAPIDALVGSEPFVLLHAPIESTQNQLQAVRAAQLADLPLVIAGPVTDSDYAALVRAFAGDRTILIGEPAPAVLEALYRGADVFLDVAWVGLGLARCARAVSRGAAVTVSTRMPGADFELGDFLCPVDPADVEGIARGIGDAWYRRRDEPEQFAAARFDFATRAAVAEVTRALVAGYAKALERRNSLVAR